MTFYLAIVGTSKALSDNEERDIRQKITSILKSYIPIETTIISGGAKGVDKIAFEIALQLGFAIKYYNPMIAEWEQDGVGYKQRNIEIANDCNELFCITTQVHDMECYHHNPPANHQKTAGCYTLNLARCSGKKVTLYVTSSR